MSDSAKQRAVTFSFKDTSKFTMCFKVENGDGERTFYYGGKSALTTCHGACSPQCRKEICEGGGGTTSGGGSSGGTTGGTTGGSTTGGADGGTTGGSSGGSTTGGSSDGTTGGSTTGGST